MALSIEHHPVAPFCTRLENPWARIERFFIDVLAAIVIKSFELPADRTISIPHRGMILPLRAGFCPFRDPTRARFERFYSGYPLISVIKSF
jgi:hypothetical protein